MIKSVLSHFAIHSMTAAGSPISVLSVCSTPEKWVQANSPRRRACWTRACWSIGENEFALSFESQGVSGAGPLMYSGTKLQAFNTVTAASQRWAMSLTDDAMSAVASEKTMGKRILRKCIKDYAFFRH